MVSSGNSSEVALILEVHEEVKNFTAKSEKQGQKTEVRYAMNDSSPYGDLYNWSVTDPTSFWQGQAEAIHWQTPFHTVCDFTNPPFVRWFVGGKTNLCYNAVDRHLETRSALENSRANFLF